MFRFWHNWLVTVAALMAAFGLVVVAAAVTPLLGALTAVLDPILWAGAAPAVDAAAQAFFYGVLGATMAGWGIMTLALAWHGFPSREPWVWRTLVISLEVWFILDSLASYLVGAVGNIGGNVVFLLLFAAPLAATWGEFRGPATMRASTAT